MRGISAPLMRLASFNTISKIESSAAGDFHRQRKMNIFLGETVLSHLGALLPEEFRGLLHQMVWHRCA